MFTLNPDYAVPETATETPAPRFDNLGRSPKNRVGDFFSESSDRVGSNEPVTLIVTIEITVYRYETASGVHKYLYANAGPNMFVDPSGNMSLSSLSSVTSIIGRLARMARPAIRTFYKARCKITTVVYKSAQAVGSALPKCQKTLGGVRQSSAKKWQIELKIAALGTELLFRQLYWAFGCTKTFKNNTPKGHLQRTANIRKQIVNCSTHLAFLCSSK